MGLLLALLFAVALAVFAAVNATNEVTLNLLFGYRLAGVQVWWLIAGAGLVTALIAWIFGVRATWRFKRELRRREEEIDDLRKRLEQAHDSLQDYESRMHEFALKVVQMAHRQLPPTPEEAAQELAQSVPTTLEGETPPAESEPAATAEEPAPSTPPEKTAAKQDDDPDDDDYI